MSYAPYACARTAVAVVLTVTASTLSGINGVYGNGALNLTGVDRKNPMGSTPELCSFNFDGANQLASNATAFGDIRYQSDAKVLYTAFLNFDVVAATTLAKYISGGMAWIGPTSKNQRLRPIPSLKRSISCWAFSGSR